MKEKINLLDNAERIFNGREIIINAFKNKIFPINWEERYFEDEDKDDIRDENNLINHKKLYRLISVK